MNGNFLMDLMLKGYFKGAQSKSIKGCKCGFEHGKNDYSDKRLECLVTGALQNHITFPCLELVNNYHEPSKFYMKVCQNENVLGTDHGTPRRHWALLSEIQNLPTCDKGCYCGQGWDGINQFAERFSFRIMKTLGKGVKPDTFQWEDAQIGHTGVCLYASKMVSSNGIDGIGTYHYDSCFIFKAPLATVIHEASLLLRDADSVHLGEKPTCFECSKETINLSKCSACKLAKYCSKECQAKSWKKCHKRLCSQSEVLLRLASLPRQPKFKHHFSFKLNVHNSIPSYTFNPKFLQKNLNITNETESEINAENPSQSDKCGLCKRSADESKKANGSPLTKTDCCNNWICDDGHKYVLNSYGKMSCYRNHNRDTVCGNHYDNGHKGDWQTCNVCRNEHELNNSFINYIYMSTNEFNFVKNKSLRKVQINCANCDYFSFDLKNFCSQTISRMEPSKYYCRNEKCKRECGFFGYDESAFVCTTSFS